MLVLLATAVFIDPKIAGGLRDVLTKSMTACSQTCRTHFTLNKGLEKRLRRCSAAAQSTFAFALVIYIFLLPPVPCFVHRVHTKPPVFREGSPTFSFEQRLIGIAPVKLSRGSSSFL